MNWLMTQINRIRTWWNTNHANIEQDVIEGTRRIGRGMDRISRNIGRLILMGVIINVISNYFYPEFATRFPIIYGWFDGWLQLGEIALKAGLGGIYAFFTGNFSEFWSEYSSAVNEAIQQFVNWLSMIHFQQSKGFPSVYIDGFPIFIYICIVILLKYDIL